MQLDNRIGWLLVGGVAGFALGYIVRSFQESKARKEGFTDVPPDGGFFRSEVLNRIALGLVVLLVAFSSFRSQEASNDVKDAQAKVKAAQAQQIVIVSCSQSYLTKTIAALNARTQYSQQNNRAIVALQVAQAKFLRSFILQNPKPAVLDQAALASYFEKLNAFIAASNASNRTFTDNPYPTVTEFTDCVKKG